jgi:eukaryotic-like serine/threonine-protein kinase
MNPDQADDRRATMLPERWNIVKDKLFAALELEGAERTAYLEEIARQDPELRYELDSLIASHEQASTAFLNQPAAHIAKLITASPQDLIGRRLGPYQLVRQIGIGGMGEVYRAFRADDQYRKEVAIKLVRAGQGSGFILERFKNERQILASLEHPNICRLLDGGTTPEGLPYFVMELIEGEPIDKYCAEHKSSVEHRLELFLQVCSAVQFAHQRLIVHRDIKPANILVTKEGQPKLLDFGIAKILDPSAIDRAAPVTLFQVLTPGYASPEQIKGEPITTTSDVYSLGVVLYELLTEQSPYQITTSVSHEISRAVCEDEPRKPSTTVCENQDRPTSSERSGEKVPKRMQGDLDNIVLMALRKEPGRRYSSVEQFAEDIRRHLQNLPVLARQDSFRYRTSKFVLRHKAGVLAAAAATIALLAGVGVILHEARIARQQAQLAQEQRMRAERRFNDVRKLANSLMFEVHDSIKDLPGSTPARKLLVSRALEYLNSLNAEAKNDASLQQEMAAAYEKIGDVQGQPRQANLGDPGGAADSYRKALAIRESLATADPKDLEVRRQLVPNYAKLSDLLWAMGDQAGAMEYSGKAFNEAEALYHGDPKGQVDRFLYAKYRMDYGYKQAVVAGNRDPGLENLREGSSMLEQLASEQPGDLQARRILGLSYSRAAEILREDPKERSQALALYKKAITAKQGLVAAEPNNAEFQRLVAYDHFSIGELLATMDQNDAALAQDREALSSFQKLAAGDPANMQFQQDIGRVRAQIGQVLIDLGQLSTGMDQLRSSLSTLESIPDASNQRSLVGFTILTDQLWLGKVQVMLASSKSASRQQAAEHCREADSWFSKCLPGFEAIRDHASPQYEGAALVNEVNQETARCKQIVKNADTPRAQ